MKYSIILFSLITVLFSSCDPINFGTYHIENTTLKNLEVRFYGVVQSEQDTLNLPPNEITEWRKISGRGDGETRINMYKYYDSITLLLDDRVIKTYNSNSRGKSIYDYQFWDVKDKGNDHYEYTYSIEKSDIAE